MSDPFLPNLQSFLVLARVDETPHGEILIHPIEDVTGLVEEPVDLTVYVRFTNFKGRRHIAIHVQGDEYDDIVDFGYVEGNPDFPYLGKGSGKAPVLLNRAGTVLFTVLVDDEIVGYPWSILVRE